MKRRDTDRVVNLPSNKYEAKGELPESYELAEARKLPRDFGGEVEVAKSLRTPEIICWDYGLAFIRGDQSFVSDRFEINRTRLKQLQDKALGVMNIVLSIYRATMSMMRAQEPGVQVQSLMPTYESELQVLTNQWAAKALYRNNRLDRYQNLMNRWLSATGSAAWHVYPEITPEKEKVCIELVNPYNILFEPYCQDPEEARWSAVRKFMRREDAVAMFPDAKDVLEDVTAFNGDGEQPEGQETLPHDRLELWWVYFADGRCGVWCSNQWVYESEFPVDATPITLVRWTPLPNRIYGLSQMMPLLLPQFRYNQMSELLYEIMKVTSAPHWLIPRAAQVDKRSLRNEPGNVVEYNDNAMAPQQVKGPDASPSLWDYLATHRATMEDLGGVHSATTGKRVPNVGSAIGMETLIDQDQAQLDLTQQEVEYGLSRAIKTGLVFWKHYMPERTLVRIPGKVANQLVSKTVETTNLSDQPDVIIKAGSAFSMSKDRKDAFVMQLVQAGLPIQMALPHLSVQLDDRAEFDKAQALFFAKSLLDAVLQGATIEWVPEPSFMEAVEHVFGEFIRSPEYYLGVGDLKAQAEQEAMAAQQAQQQQMMAAEAGMPVEPGMEPPAPATDELQALNNVWTIYQDVVMTRAQMMAGGPAPSGPPMGSMPGGDDQQAAGRRGSMTGQPERANQGAKSQQHGPAGRDRTTTDGPVNASTSFDTTSFRTPGISGAP